MASTNGKGANGNGAFDVRHMSRNMLDGVERAGARAMLKGIGLTDEDLKKPMVLIANTWIETMPCNFGLRTLAHAVKEGVRAAGGVPMEMNTIAISDGVTMGTEGMKTSLISRELIADSVELVGRGHMFDAVIGLGACDKTLPGLSMALARAQYPGLPDLRWHDPAGRSQRARGDGPLGLRGDRRLQGRQDQRRGAQALRGSCLPDSTAPAAASTRPTRWRWRWSSSASPRSVPPARRPSPTSSGSRGRHQGSMSSTRARWRSAARPAILIMDMLKQGIRPLDILTREAFENAIAGVAASGGSTNAVLHLLALAREAKVELSIDDFDEISRRTPLISDMMPGGRYAAADLDKAGGTPLVAKRMIEGGNLRGDQISPSGQHVRGRSRGRGRDAGSGCGRARSTTRSRSHGGLVILKGNIAPDGARDQALRLRAPLPQGTGPSLRFRARGARGGLREQDQPGRCRRHPVRGTEGRTRYAGDAGDHRGD